MSASPVGSPKYAVERGGSGHAKSSYRRSSRVLTALVVLGCGAAFLVGLQHAAQGATLLLRSPTTGSRAQLPRSKQLHRSMLGAVKDQIAKEMQGNSDWNALFSRSSRAQQAPTLLALTTSNVWNKTQLMLSSLWTARDAFDLLVVDERSTDGTLAELAKYNVTVMRVPATKGVVNGLHTALNALARCNGCLHNMLQVCQPAVACLGLLNCC